MYNVKLIEYPNGSYQIRRYSKLVGSTEHTSAEQDKEPFTMKKVRTVTEFSNIDDNLTKSFSRTKNKIFTYARCYKWEYFCTFTYDKQKIDRYSFDECMKKIRVWLNNQRRIAPDLKYLAVPEQHLDGAWHLHVLLADIGTLELKKTSKKYNKMTIYNISNWKWGFSTATKIQDTFRIQSYITKYITKDCYQNTRHKHRYYVSRNLPKPKEICFLVSWEENKTFLEQLITSLPAELQHVKSIHTDFTDIAYFELF